MKITIKTLLVLLIASITISCDQKASKVVSQAEETKVEEQSSKQAEKQTEVLVEEKLRLNNGAKWASDQSTFFGMQKLETALKEYNKSYETPSLEDYKILGESLANINKEIISQCSMKGEDHDQLHIVLHPMLENVDVIKNGSDLNEATKNTIALANSLNKFFDFFEVK